VERAIAVIWFPLFIQDLTMEPYLTSLEPRHSRVLTKFRTGNHRLPIITGRYENIDRQDRLCTKCQEGKVGSEYHYLLECSFFTQERENFIGEEFTIDPESNTMKELLNSKDETVLQNLAKFVRIIMLHFHD